jgi:ABC-2 type transport system permease protein
MSGVFTPLESMPQWAQKIDVINPLAYLMRINRMVMLKGSTIHDIARDIYALILIAIAFTTFAVSRYRKTA